MARAPEVTINHDAKPSATVSIAGEVEVTDFQGRKLLLKKLRPLDKMRASLACGKAWDNGGYAGYAMFVFSVKSIDGLPILEPKNQVELEALIMRFEEEDIEVISKAHIEHFNVKPVTTEEVEAVKN